jgi:hypothetical protein
VQISELRLFTSSDDPPHKSESQELTSEMEIMEWIEDGVYYCSLELGKSGYILMCCFDCIFNWTKLKSGRNKVEEWVDLGIRVRFITYFPDFDFLKFEI